MAPVFEFARTGCILELALCVTKQAFTPGKVRIRQNLWKRDMKANRDQALFDGGAAYAFAIQPAAKNALCKSHDIQALARPV